MKLEQLLLHTSYESVQGSPIQEITDICYHSGKVRCGSLFVCLRGFRTDGHRFLSDAIALGAVVAVVDTDFSAGEVEGVTIVTVRDTRKALAQLSAAFFDFPARKLRMIGITGTKGKTTTAYLTAEVLREAGHQVGMIGTISIDDGREVTPAENTTPESCEVQRYLARMVDNGCDCCVMEVSSQGLKMHRVAEIYYDIGVFLNIEPDHIGKGEHASFAEYLSCKKALLQQSRIGIINWDEPLKEMVLRGHTCEVEYFSTEKCGSCRVENIRFRMQEGKLYSKFDLWTEDIWIPLAIQLPGMFNVSNAVAVAMIVKHFDVSVEALQRGLEKATVPGRCENVGLTDGYVLLIDYAHNEMSLKNLLQTLRMFQPKRLVVLFGCGGNRSGLRRGSMGEMAGALADFTILTSDNPRWENAEDILDDIEQGIKLTAGAYVRIADRREAITYAVRHAQEGDIIVVAGKGHEGYQEICGVKYPMLDRELVEDALRQ